MRVWLLVPLCVFCVAAAVLFSSETQRTTSPTTYAEAEDRAAAALDLPEPRPGARRHARHPLPRARSQDYVARGRRTGVAAAPRGGHLVRRPPELATIARQRAALPRVAAAREARAGRRPRARPARRRAARDHLIDTFPPPTTTTSAAGGQPRRGESAAAALVAVWLTLLVSGLFSHRRGPAGHPHAPPRAPPGADERAAPATPRTRSAPRRCASARRCRWRRRSPRPTG